MGTIKSKIKEIIMFNGVEYERNIEDIAQLITTEIDARLHSVEQETKVKLLASINSFLAEQGIKDTDGTPLTFSPERF